MLSAEGIENAVKAPVETLSLYRGCRSFVVNHPAGAFVKVYAKNGEELYFGPYGLTDGIAIMVYLSVGDSEIQ